MISNLLFGQGRGLYGLVVMVVVAGAAVVTLDHFTQIIIISINKWWSLGQCQTDPKVRITRTTKSIHMKWPILITARCTFRVILCGWLLSSCQTHSTHSICPGTKMMEHYDGRWATIVPVISDDVICIKLISNKTVLIYRLKSANPAIFTNFSGPHTTNILYLNINHNYFNYFV